MRGYANDMAAFCHCIVLSLDDVEGNLPFVLTKRQREGALALSDQLDLDKKDLNSLADKSYIFCYSIMSDTHPGIIEDVTNCPVLRYIILSSLREGGRWLAAAQVVTIFMGSQYWQRLVIFARMQRTQNRAGGLMK